MDLDSGYLLRRFRISASGATGVAVSDSDRNDTGLVRLSPYSTLCHEPNIFT